MSNGATRYFMGDVYVGEVGVGFVVCDSRGDDAEVMIGEETAQAIVAASDAEVDGPVQPVNLFEISQDEFDLFRDEEITLSHLPDGLQVWRVKS
ncbi:MAG: hypothetical protein ABI540_09645 [Spartobacteria bacterium]